MKLRLLFFIALLELAIAAAVVDAAGWGTNVKPSTTTEPPVERFSLEHAVMRSDEFDAVLRGGWKTVDLSPYDQMTDELFSSLGNDVEGNSRQLIKERKIYIALASLPQVKTICEIGFNAGHSAALWLRANPTAKVYMFDLWRHDYSPKAEAILRDPTKGGRYLKNADERLTVIKGSSLETVPRFVAENGEQVQCNLLSVDGGHQYHIASKDIENMRPLADRSFHVVVVDDTNCRPLYCVDKAVKDKITTGMLTPKLLAVSEVPIEFGGYGRGVTVIQYQPDRLVSDVFNKIRGDISNSESTFSPSLSEGERRVASGARLKGLGNQSRLLLSVARHLGPSAKRVCEFGFNAAYKADVWPQLLPNAEVFIFDGRKASSRRASNAEINEADGDGGDGGRNSRVKVIALPEAISADSIRQGVSAFTDIRCDLLSITGVRNNHLLRYVLAGAKLLANTANKKHAVIIDNTNCLKKKKYCVDKSLADGIADGVLTTHLVRVSDPVRGSGVGGDHARFGGGGGVAEWSRGMSLLQFRAPS